MSFLLGPPLRAAGLALAVAWALPVAANPSNADVLPDYEALIARLEQMPAAVEAAAQAEAAQARARQARALPNPSVSVESENVYGSGPYAGFDSAETTIAINQPLELWGQRGARVAVARAEADAAGLRRRGDGWLDARDRNTDRTRRRLVQRVVSMGPRVLERPEAETSLRELRRLAHDLEHYRQRVHDLVYDAVELELGGSE